MKRAHVFGWGGGLGVCVVLTDLLLSPGADRVKQLLAAKSIGVQSPFSEKREKIQPKVLLP